MRWVLIAMLSISALAEAGPAQSNPAFLGIGFDNIPGAGCVIESVTRLAAAAEAGIDVGDVILAIDYLPMLHAPCDQLVAAIVAHQPGDRVRLDVRRNGRTFVANATLTTRAEVLQRRVGRHMESTDLVDTEDVRRSYDLGERRDRTTVVGWFTKDCVGCAKVFDRVNDGISRRIHDGSPLVLAVVAYAPHDPLAAHDASAEYAALRKGFASSVPLAVADGGIVDSIAMLDKDRVFFMVIDCRGTVQFVAPVAPDADDLEAALDDVLAAAEQAEHARLSRR